MSQYVQQASIATGTSDRRIAARAKYPTVYWAAALGVILLAFEIYVLINWVTGPNFVRVPVGPSELPGWMKLTIDVFQPLWVLNAVYWTWRALLRPLLTEGRVSNWGLMWPVMMLTSVYDASSCYFHDWFGYNSYFLNYGNPVVGALPGWHGFAQPGAMNAWPVLFIPSVYPVLFMATAWLCMKFMAALRGRFPQIPVVALIGLCLIFALTLDILFEGLLMMRLGWYAENGAAVVNSGLSFQLPWRNAISAAFVFTAMGSVFYFRDDHGHNFVERGLERFARNSPKEIALRFFALLAVMQCIMIGLYHVPVAVLEDHFPAHWAESIASTSYLNDHICGFGTPRTCP